MQEESQEQFVWPQQLIKHAVPSPLPEWLTAPAVPAQPSPNRYLLAEINHEIYNNMLEHVLDKLSEGQSIGSILRACNRGKELGQFIRWMMKDQKRKARYEEALMFGAEVMKAQLVDIADGISEDGSEVPEDIQRSKLRIDTRLKTMGFDNKKKYGDTKTIEINQNISITDALAQARQRVADVIDAEVCLPKLENDDE